MAWHGMLRQQAVPQRFALTRRSSAGLSNCLLQLHPTAMTAVPHRVVPLPCRSALFRVVDFAAFPHTLRLSLGALADTLDARGALHTALGSSRRRGFHASLRRLAERHFGEASEHWAAAAEEARGGGSGDAGGAQVGAGKGERARYLQGLCVRLAAPRLCLCYSRAQVARLHHQLWMELPLVCKVYAAAAAAGGAPPARAVGSSPEAERVCFFCGGPVSDS